MNNNRDTAHPAIANAFFFAILIFASIAFVVLLTPFFEPILWATALAVLFQPLQRKLLVVCKQRINFAALATLLIICITVIVPAIFLSIAVSKEGVTLYQDISSGEIDFSGPINWIQKSLPSVIEQGKSLGIDIVELKQKISSSALQSSQWFASHVISFGQNTLRFTVLFFIMLYLLFFFLRDGEKIISLIVRILPLGDEREHFLLSKFAEVSRATIKGTLVVGMVQGSLGGIMFAILGIQSAIFWAVIMTLLSIIPAVGSALIWIPAAIYLIANGMLAKGIILIVFGAVVIGMADNILRPMLVGRDTKMPDYLILLSTLGGLAMVGISGFVLGPIIAAFFLTIWVMFEQEYNPSQ
jgi:predicted PurR-regulated permease PerM